MSRNSTLDEPADVNADLGTPTWARGVARALEFQAKKLNSDVRSVHEWIAIADEHQAWRVLGYVSLDVFLVAEAAITQAVIDAIRNAKGGTIGDAIKSAEATKEKQKPGPKLGDQDAINLIATKPNSNGAVLRRLARDNPEMLDRIEAGEMSVNAAAIAAGIRKKATPEEIVVKTFAKVDDRLETLRSIIQTLAPHEALVVRGWLNEVVDT